MRRRMLVVDDPGGYMAELVAERLIKLLVRVKNAR